MRSTIVIRGARRAATALTSALVLAMAITATTPGCNAGGGTRTALEPGPTTTAQPGNLILYTCMSRADRVEAYRLGTDGLLPPGPFSRTLNIENPRRLLLVDDILYVALDEGIISLELGPDGSLPQKPSSATTPVVGTEVLEMKVRNGILYAAVAGFDAIEAYELDENGRLPLSPDSTANGRFSNEYRTLDFGERGEFLYASGRNASVVDTSRLETDGMLPDEAEVQIPETVVALPEDILIDGDVLHITDGGEQAVSSFLIQPDGLLREDPEATTENSEFYTNLFLGDGVIYASAFQKGRIDTYPIDPITGYVVDESPALFSTVADANSRPTQILNHLNVLYVAQAGLGRIDAYILNSAGLPTAFPSSSTLPVDDGFPTDLALLVLD